MALQREDFRRVHQKALNAVAAVTNGSAVAVHGNSKHSLQVKGITTATVKLQRSSLEEPSVDADWVDIGSVTADGYIDGADKPALWLRAIVSAYTSGTISAWLASTP